MPNEVFIKSFNRPAPHAWMYDKLIYMKQNSHLLCFAKVCIEFTPYLIIATVLAVIFYVTGFDRNWSFWADQELTLGYSGLLINSGLNQEYIDHPGGFSIQLISPLLTAGSYLGFSDIHNMGALAIKKLIAILMLRP